MAMSTEFTELFPNLPEELALECLTRLNYAARCVGALVCRRWRELLLSRDFFYHRKRTGFTQKAAVMVQSIPVQGEIPVRFPSYGLTIYYPESGIWDRVDPVPEYPDGLPLFCQVVSSEGKLVVMGGLDPTSWEPVRDVFVYEFTTGSWTRRRDMPSCRSFFAAAAVDGVVFVAGGHDANKNSLSTAWKYDIWADGWTELPGMNEERDECEGIVVGSEFWVVSGYATQAQGRFMRSAESFGPGTGEWRLAQDAWVVTQSPTTCGGVGAGNGAFVSWAEIDPVVQAVGLVAFGVDMDGWTLETGREHHSGPFGFYHVERKNEGQIGKVVKIEAPEEFSGCARSGGCIEF
ncbi:F-box/kelch-repeat protein At1g80440-like [Rhododendron vialii]|uniref:F-box/kelch-repeat protein At1g80440-like n=1 Tax=Rhododendron vialii TaxID=182163 RepID=UPI00265EB1F1|nr:F-box/kelch-repeat protein At1g80440-like [Rhododendron vialii]